MIAAGDAQQLAQSFRVLGEVLNIISMIEDAATLEKGFKLETRRETKEEARLVCRQIAGAIASNGNSFESLSRGVGVLRQVVGKIHSNLHGEDSSAGLKQD
jgi:hypothetical protein